MSQYNVSKSEFSTRARDIMQKKIDAGRGAAHGRPIPFFFWRVRNMNMFDRRPMVDDPVQWGADRAVVIAVVNDPEADWVVLVRVYHEERESIIPSRCWFDVATARDWNMRVTRGEEGTWIAK